MQRNVHAERTNPMIRKLSTGEYRLYSRKKNPSTVKRRNLGTFHSRAAAEKHEREVQYFKQQQTGVMPAFDLAIRRKTLTAIRTECVCFRFFAHITLQNSVPAQMLISATHAENIVQTVREPLLVLDSDLTIKTASRSFYFKFKMTPEQTLGRPLAELGGGAWNTPAFHKLLHDVIASDRAFNDYALKAEFPHVGTRSLLLNARRLLGEGHTRGYSSSSQWRMPANACNWNRPSHDSRSGSA